MSIASHAVGSAVLKPRVDLVDRVEAMPLETAPFDHLCFESMFPHGEYRRLLDHLPETRRYRQLTHREAMQPDGSSARRKFYLLPEHIMWLPREQRVYWRELSRQLRSRELQEAFKSKFRAALEQRFGTSIDKLAFYPVPMLLRDLGGYRLGIHGDAQRKAITVQFYLPRDESQAHMGTVFHEGRNGEAAQRTKRMAFVPGAGYALPGNPAQELAQRPADFRLGWRAQLADAHLPCPAGPARLACPASPPGGRLHRLRLAQVMSRIRMVPGAGVEPARACAQRFLRPSRLPVPPPRRG